MEEKYIKITTSQFPSFHKYNDITMYANACATWRIQFEKELNSKLTRLEQPRAGSIWTLQEEEAMRFILKEILGLSTEKEIANFHRWRAEWIKKGLLSQAEEKQKP